MISSNPNYLPKATSPNITILGVKPSTYEFEGYTNIQSITHTPYPQEASCLCLTPKSTWLRFSEIPGKWFSRGSITSANVKRGPILLLIFM